MQFSVEVVHLASSPLPSLIKCFISVIGAWNGGSWLGFRDLPAMGAVFYLGAGWPQWKPLGIPGINTVNLVVMGFQNI